MHVQLNNLVTRRSLFTCDAKEYDDTKHVAEL